MRIADIADRQAYPATTQRFRILNLSYSSSLVVLLYYCNTYEALLCSLGGSGAAAALYPILSIGSVCGSKVQGRVHPEDVSMRNEPRYALEMSQDFKGFLTLWFWLFL